MYAVIKTGGKQTRVAEGERVDIERLGKAVGDEVTFTPVLVVDGDDVLSTADDLAEASTGFKYKNKTRSRTRWGHRQKYDTIEITGISTNLTKKS